MKKGIIYKVTNLVNNKIYVGLTKRNLHIRKLNHQSAAFTQVNNLLFHNALRKHGIENFKWEVIWEGDVNLLAKMEKYFIICCKSHYKYKQGYNLTSGGELPPQCKGLKNPRANHKLYTFYHLYGTIEKDITQFDMKVKYNLSFSGISQLINNKIKFHRNWTINKEYFNLKARYKLFSFIHINGTIEKEVSRSYMLHKYKMDNNWLRKLCSKKKNITKDGWMLLN